jgi:2-keto-4-pentenoate hydratase
MTMDPQQIETAGRDLAHARKNGLVINLALRDIASDEDAEAVQLEAAEAMDDQPRGYSTLTFRERIGDLKQADSFVHGLLMANAIFDTGSTFRAPQGLMGARSALLFTFGRSYPDKEEITRTTVTSAILQCELAIELLGRRVPGSVPLTARIAMADFALHVATFRGSPVAQWSDAFWNERSIVFNIDGHPVQKIMSATFLAHCLDCLNLLADTLAQNGRQINAGDLVSAGWRLPALQVCAGQSLRIDFAGLGSVEVRVD